MGKHKIIISLILLAIILGILLFLDWISLSQQKLTVYNPDSYGPYGLKALCLSLEKSNYRFTLSENLPNDRNQLVILRTNSQISKKLKKHILNWVKSGGAIVELAQNTPNLIPDASGLQLSSLLKSKKTTFTSKAYCLGNLSYYLSNKTTNIIRHPKQGFYGAKEGYFIAAQKYGLGSILYWNDLDGLTNQAITKHPDNVVILITLLKNLYPTVKEISILQLPPPPLQPLENFNLAPMLNRYWGASLLFGLGIILLLWKVAVRFGRIVPLSFTPGRSYQEFVVSMAGLFQQANIQKLVLENLYQELWKLVTEITGSLPDAPITGTISSLNIITGGNYQDISEISIKIANLTKKIPKQEFLKICAKLDVYRKELIEWKKSR